MTRLTRRRFVTRGAVGVALAGAAAALPSLGTLLKAPTPDAAALDVPAGAGPLIVHVSDVGKGEMEIFAGTDQVAHRDAELAARLFHATRGR